MSSVEPSSQSSDRTIRAPIAHSPLAEGVARARQLLVGLQREDGHWCGELEGDSILESEYVMTMFFLGRGEETKVAKAGRSLRQKQLEGGGWGLFPGGAADVNPTVKAYFVLKLLGDDPEAPHMVAARQVALRLGGVDACNSFTRIYLAIFGQLPWSHCPAVPPELVLLPTWSPLNIYQMSSWSRAIVVPLSIIRALKPACPVPPGAGIAELRVAADVTAGPSSNGGPPTARTAPSVPRRVAAWAAFFRAVDGLLRAYENRPLPALRRWALRRAREWTETRFEGSDGLGAIFPPIVNSIVALRCLGVATDDPLLASQIEQLERLEVEEEETLRLQPCFSPVWDTALALSVLLDAGLDGGSEPARRAARWLVEHESRTLGDWSRGRRDPQPGGWYFEYANSFYPDCDDTAQVITALSKLDITSDAERGKLDGAIGRGVCWLAGMQHRSGGWAAFDRDCDSQWLTHIPFADHNAMIDPPTVDVTARAIEALLRTGARDDSPQLLRAVDFLRREQEDDGSWYGRWGCNYLYGSWLALGALRQAGESADSKVICRGRRWISSCQNLDGGWGELPDSYVNPARKGCGPSTPSQTGWALLGLMAAGEGADRAIERGIDYLLSHQEPAGGWHEEAWTGTGFPEVFYLRYHLYSTYFPLMALAFHQRLTAGDDPFAITPVDRGRD